jgi:plasmid stabilization system protein ParE
MKYPIRFSDAAEDDLTEIIAYYESQKVGLGLAFESELETMLEYLSDAPLLYPITWKNIRRMNLERYTYAVYYIVEDSWLSVIAVLHQARNPYHWKKRIE